jgi:hypothetical protein
MLSPRPPRNDRPARSAPLSAEVTELGLRPGPRTSRGSCLRPCRAELAEFQSPRGTAGNSPPALAVGGAIAINRVPEGRQKPLLRPARPSSLVTGSLPVTTPPRHASRSGFKFGKVARQRLRRFPRVPLAFRLAPLNFYKRPRNYAPPASSSHCAGRCRPRAPTRRLFRRQICLGPHVDHTPGHSTPSPTPLRAVPGALRSRGS